MKQFLVYLLILMFSVPSFAGNYAIDVDISEQQTAQIELKSPHSHQQTSHHCHQSKSESASQTSKIQNHDCCEQSEIAVSHAHSACDDNCDDCSHSCAGVCLALLSTENPAVVAQSQFYLLRLVKLPESPYQNPLIPPII